jgi:hypothetical protein
MNYNELDMRYNEIDLSSIVILDYIHSLNYIRKSRNNRIIVVL